ncbi:MAG: HlyD family efflux transporter periplasmic adaptor subunit [Sulfitobacter sp.]
MSWKRNGLIAATLIVISVGAYGAWLSSTKSNLPAGIASSNGRIEATRIDVATKTAGRVAKVLVSEGDWVEAGTLVARMDTVEIDAQLHQAQAAVVQAEQQKLQADAVLNQTLSQQNFAQAEYTRTETLASNGHATQERLDQRALELATADASVASSKAGIDLAVATIASANASVERLQSILGDAELIASRNGRVQYVLEHVGEVVGAGGTVVTLTDLTDMYMTIYLPAGDAGLLAIGSEARIILDPIPEYVIPAAVSFVSSTEQFTPKSVETADERDQLMFRVKLTIPVELLEQHLEQAKAGVAGIAYVRTDDTVAWPDMLMVTLPQ